MTVLRKNQQITLTTDDLSHQGQGVGRFEGMAVFVPGALPGEELLVQIIKVQKNYAIGKLLEVKKLSPFRQEAPCPVFDKCGGCALQHMHYEQQLLQKRKWVLENLRRIAGVENADELVFDTIGMENPWRYRNKASFPFGEINGRVELGFYAPRSHRLIPIEDCLLQQEIIIKAMKLVRKWANDKSISVYNEETHKGLLRHLVLRNGNIGDKTLMMTIVTSRDELPETGALIDMIQKELPELASLSHNVQGKANNVILGENSRLLWGEERVEEKLEDLVFSVSERSFLQVNSQQTQKLYAKVLKYANLNGQETVVDAYCGIGTISLLLAKKAAKLIGVEIVPEAVEDAKKNATRNGFSNAEFLLEPAEVFLPRFQKEGGKLDLLVLDPPRKGCDAALLNAALAVKPDKIIYVSCDPATWARDAAILLEKETYSLKEVQPLDMFAQSAGVELVSLFERKE